MYLQEEHYYLISNHAVARNSIFCNKGIQDHFKNKMEYYLEPICDILAFNLRDQEFQILVRLKERAEFENYFQVKNEGYPGYLQTPESTYVFSQAMANLQVSLVKKFNFMNNRRGTLLAGRFNRELVTSKGRVIELIQLLNEGKQENRYSGIWAECSMKRISGMTSADVYKALEMSCNGGSEVFWGNFHDNLVGRFYSPDKKVGEFKFQFLQRRLFKSICKYFE